MTIATDSTERASVCVPGAARGSGRARSLKWIGPSFVAAIAYVDPGNFATNFQAGADYGYLLIWVVVAANAVAVFVQYLSAKIGLATGRDLPSLFRDTHSRRAARLMWIPAELTAMATDVAEFIGAALGMNLLFGMDMTAAAVAVGLISFGMLVVQRRSHRWFESMIIALLGLITCWFCYELALVGRPSLSALRQGMVPRLANGESVTLAVGIIGATVMPHAIHLHSALTAERRQPTGGNERRRALRLLRADCLVGLSSAGVVNVLMLCVAVAVFGRLNHSFDGKLASVHAALANGFGTAAATAFALALLSSGLASSGVGTYAGQIVMQGLIHRRVPVWARRAVTMAPALVLVACGIPADTLLIASQVVLSFGIPFALVPLVLLSARRNVMGALVNRPTTTVAGSLVAFAISGLNLYLLWRMTAG